MLNRPHCFFLYTSHTKKKINKLKVFFSVTCHSYLAQHVPEAKQTLDPLLVHKLSKLNWKLQKLREKSHTENCMTYMEILVKDLISHSPSTSLG